MFDAVTPEEIVLKVREVGLSMEVSRTFLQSCVRSVLCDGLAVSLIGYVAEGSRHVEERRTFPRSWWDAVKLRFFPDWLRLWFPADVEVVETVVVSVCPHVGAEPRGGECLRFLKFGRAGLVDRRDFEPGTADLNDPRIP